MLRVPDGAGKGVENAGILAAAGQALQPAVEPQRVLPPEVIGPAKAEPHQVLGNRWPDARQTSEVGARGTLSGGLLAAAGWR